jgi:hypothetical protein
MGTTINTPATTTPASCGSCGIHACDFNAEATLCRVPLGEEAWLLDETWPEFDAYLGQRSAHDALLFAAWKNKHLRPSAYRWSCMGDRRATAPNLLSVRRSLAMRGSRWSGGRRQAILENFDERYAAYFARRIPYNVVRFVVWQNFLPFLQQQKTLGGREYEILLWRAPRHVLQQTLDLAAQHYPESATLRDFRSDPAHAENERVACENARRVVTPHRELAKLYADKSVTLDWSIPPIVEEKARGTRVAFLGPTIGRRGAYVVRAAVQKLGLSLLVLGRNLEHPDFWRGTDVEERPIGPDCLHDVGLLLSPAITDFKPRLILRALANGIRIIATPACGLPETTGLTLTDPFDADALAAKIEAWRS